MPGTKLDQLLARVVERKGYTVQGADEEALFARKGDETLLAAWKLDGPLTAADAQIFLAAFGQVQAATGVLVAPKGAEQAAKDAIASNKGIEIWAESRLVVEVGEAFVKDALEGPVVPAGPTPYPSAAPSQAQAPAAARPASKFPSLVAQAATAATTTSTGAAYFMPNKKKEQPADMQATIQQGRGGSLGYAWGGMGSGTNSTSAGIAQVRNGRHPSKKVDQWGNLIDPAKEAAQQAAAAARAAPAAMEDVEIVSTPKKGRAAPGATATAAPAPASKFINAEEEAYEIITTKKPAAAAPVMKESSAPACTTLRLTVSKEEAVAKTGKPGNAKLALVPHVAFDFDLEMSRPGMGAPVSARGSLLLSSITGDLRVVDGLAFADAEPTDCRKDQEKLTAVDLYDKVKGYMVKTYSKTMSVEREVAGNTVMENLKLVPDQDEMGLQHRGIVYMPVWEVTGSTGVTKIDAFTGNVLG